MYNVAYGAEGASQAQVLTNSLDLEVEVGVYVEVEVEVGVHGLP